MKSYADDEELKCCFILPVDDSDEEEVKAKLVKCESCLMMIKDCEMKNHLKSHNMTKPFSCNSKGCFKKFNTIDNLNLHKKLFHPNDNNNTISINQKKLKELKNKIKNLNCLKNNNNNDNYEENSDNDDIEYGIGKYILEDDNGNIYEEKMILGIKNKNNNEQNNNNVILGQISAGVP